MQLLFAFSALLALTASATNLASHVPSTESTSTVDLLLLPGILPAMPDYYDNNDGSTATVKGPLPGLPSVTPADTPKPTPSFNLRGQRHLQGKRECPRICSSKASDSTGRQCCAHNGQHERCELNGPRDTCKCDYAHDPGQTR